MSKAPLVVYDASAGSGKTFTLAAEYISLLVRNPQAYRQTLAVTFTNKATEEMKTRILSQLYGIWKSLPKSDDYLDFVCKKLDVSPAFARKQAGIALHSLLHNYSYFRVETIDSFFQSVLRNLAHELDLTTNMRIGLNDLQVEEQAVDSLVNSLTTTDVVLQWLMHYIVENISDDRSWNVIGQVKQFGRTIFRDEYKGESQQLKRVVSQPGFFDGYTRQLRQLREQASGRMKEIGRLFMDQLASASLEPADFSYGTSGVAGLFVKLQNGQFDPSVIGKRIQDCVGQPAKWCSKSHARREEIMALAQGPLGQLLSTAVSEQPRQWRVYQSATLTLRHLNQLRLLDVIEMKVREQNLDSNRFLLSDTQQLLHAMIDGSDSPFIFEKIGTQLEHIMIDEFQDTSTVQWHNFKVLLDEVMGHQDTENLIVGDVKQSIYRWRSGDWRLLDGIERQFGQGMVHREPLKYNYRSCRNIVDFNNAFFLEAAAVEEAGAYANIRQLVPGDKPAEGYVDVRLLPSADYQQTTLDTIAQIVSDMLERGTPPAHIAILLRTNPNIALIANYLMERLPGVPLVSDEAFRLDASVAVNVMVQAMRLLANPDDHIAKATLARAWSGKALHDAPLDELLPEAFVGHASELQRLPLYDLAERLHTIFDLQRYSSQSAYVCTFLDHISAFVDQQQGDLEAFLAEWDENLCSTTIQSPQADGVRLISIHKSKGLEFPTVIIPFCDWRMEHSSILWCKPKEQPYSELPLVPVDYGAKQMVGTIYEDDYHEEHQQTVVDNLNLLYVAFTRAACNLFVIGKRGSKASRSAVIEQVLPRIGLDGSSLTGVEGKTEVLHYTFGSLAFARQKKADADDAQAEPNVFLAPSRPIVAELRPGVSKVVFRQSNQSREFAAAPDDDEVSRQNTYIQLGNVLHHVFSRIRTVADVDRALHELETEGIIYDEHITSEKLSAMVRQRLSDPRVAQWFFASGQTDGWRVLNECTIIDVESGERREDSGERREICGVWSEECEVRNVESGVRSVECGVRSVERRPDRVLVRGDEAIVIDFKFGAQRPAHHDQVGEYMRLLRRMGYTRLQGFLWYVFSNKIVEVHVDEYDDIFS